MNKLVILKIIQISLMINFIRQAMKIRIVLEIKEVILKNLIYLSDNIYIILLDYIQLWMSRIALLCYL